MTKLHFGTPTFRPNTILEKQILNIYTSKRPARYFER